jgi:phage/plasmid-like protein (TIGR03299 family)
MAANIEVRYDENGKRLESFVEGGENQRAWHGMGEHRENYLTVWDALKASHSDYEVSKQPIAALSPAILARIEAGEMIDPQELQRLIIDGKAATYRDDYKNTLGVVSDSYGIIQNSEAFSFIDDLVSGGKNGACINAAGVLGNGERTFITARFDPITLKGDDTIDMYVVFSNSFDGKSRLTCLVTPVRVVCQNTLNQAMRDNVGRWDIRHTSKCGDKFADVAEAARTMGLYERYKAEYIEELEALSKVRLSEVEGNRLLLKSFMTPDQYKVYAGNKFSLDTEEISTRLRNQCNALIQTAHEGVGQSMLEPYSGVWLLNALSCYNQNTAPNKDFTRQFDSLTGVAGKAYTQLNKLHDNLIALAA